MPTPDLTFIGEVRFWAAATVGMLDNWLACDGGTYSFTAEKYQLLYTVIGNAFGGNGRTTFAVPDLTHRAPIGAGYGPGLTNRELGGQYGKDSVVQTVGNMPPHAHALAIQPTAAVTIAAYDTPADKDTPSTGNHPAQGQLKAGISSAPFAQYIPQNQSGSQVPLTGLRGYASQGVLQQSGLSPPVGRENRQPQLAFGFYIAFDGVYPQRS